MSGDIELKPCPFCGRPAQLSPPNWIFCSDTVNCGAEITSGYHGDETESATIEAWNKRVKE